MKHTVIIVYAPQTALPARAIGEVLPQLGCQKEMLDLTLSDNSEYQKVREIYDACTEDSRKLLVLFDPSFPNCLKFMNWLESFPELLDNTRSCIELQDILAAESPKAWLYCPKDLDPPDVTAYMYGAAVKELYHSQKKNPSRQQTVATPVRKLPVQF